MVAKVENNSMINLWLDDERTPPPFADNGIHWQWVKTADEAVEVLKTGKVTFASLDHDLADEHYQAFQREYETGVTTSEPPKEKTGFFVLNWMEENDVWPENGVRIHTMNPFRKEQMLFVVRKNYKRNFQYQYKGTHIV